MDIKEEADLKDVLANLPGYVYRKNTLSEYIGCNKNLARISNLKNCDEIVGKKDEHFGWGEEQAEAFRADDRLVMKTGETKVTEHTLPIFQNDQLTYIHVRTEKMPLRNQRGQVMGALGVALDITELRKAQQSLKEEKERVEAENKAKTEFLEGMWHDIRASLSGILGFAELLSRETEYSKFKAHASTLVESSNELLRYLNEILESINAASGEIPVLKKKFSLQSTITNIITLHKPKALEKGLDLEFYFDEKIPNYLIGDPVRIYRIILELLVNALKFTEKGHVKVIVTLDKKMEREVIIKIAVKDTGPGIPLEKQDELFVRFKRLTPSYEGIYKNAGLGLFILKRFIDDLQGEIYVESHPDQGSKFTCVIPIKEALFDEIPEDNF